MTPDQLKEQFIGWQCRIRQYSVRKDEGRPSPGMRPGIVVNNQQLGPVNIQVVKTESADITRQFRFMVLKTQDPKARYENAIKLLSEYYYQIPAEFDEEMTAVYAMDSELAQQIVSVGRCSLDFMQGNQHYSLDCRVRSIPGEEDKHQATYWHSHLFNPAMPGTVTVLGFTPDWTVSQFKTVQAS